MVVDKNGNEIKVGDVVKKVVQDYKGTTYGEVGKTYTVTSFQGKLGLNSDHFNGAEASFFEIVKQEPKTMKYEVGKKYVIGMDWAGLSKGDVITVTNVGPYDDQYNCYQVLFSSESANITQSSFHTTSVVCDRLTPYTEPKSIVTEKVTRVIEAGEYGRLEVGENFLVGDVVKTHANLRLKGYYFDKKELGELIETLKQIHEVM